MSLEEAVDEIKRHAGTQFDPEVVEAFLIAVKRPGVRGIEAGEVYDEKLSIFRSLAEGHGFSSDMLSIDRKVSKK